jgi:hypothetical protein
MGMGTVTPAALPLCAAGTDAWPTCVPVNASGAACPGYLTAQNGVVTPPALPAYCSPFVLVGAALGILLLAPGAAKLLALAPLAAWGMLPACTQNNGCPGTLD